MLTFQQGFTQALPADAVEGSARRQVYQACYSWVNPTPTRKPVLLAYAQDVLECLDLNQSDADSPWFSRLFSGNALPSEHQGMKPYAMCYGGHQFGNWAGQLGDGRAINLGEIENSKGEHWVLQLKGAGETPYSRSADGLAVLRSSVREFLCSEAMFHLGVPTTRALSLCLTGDMVQRDMFYDGHVAAEKGAVVCRVAPSFLRFGNFQIFAKRDDATTLKTLLDYTIATDFAYLLEQYPAGSEDIYIAWFADVCEKTKAMIVHWQRVGFVHGVMNTDNMSILGLTIDYGPYGWLEDYNPDWTPNTTDAQYHRYSFGKQASISHWNLTQLAQSLVLLVDDISRLQEVVDDYAPAYQQAWQAMMVEKLGLQAFAAGDEVLIDDMLALLQVVETDMSIFYRKLADMDEHMDGAACLDVINHAFYDEKSLEAEHKQAWQAWFVRYLARLQQTGQSTREKRENMNKINPKYVLRNYLAQQAIEQAEQGDMGMLHALMQVLRHPYDEQEGNEHFAGKRPEWARHKAGCSMLSCSS